MIRITGPTRAQLDQAADQYATLLDRELAFTIQRVIAWLGDQFDADDLGVIPKFWADRLDDLLAPTLALALHVGSADIRRQLRDMLGAGQGAQAVGPGGAQAAASARRRAGDQSGNATTIGSREPGGTLADTLTAAAWNGVPVTSQQLAEAYLATARNRLVGVGDLTWQLAREQLLEGQQAGESIAQLRDRVASATGLASPRAGVIARTEILDALNYGAHAEMAATGLDGTKEWLCVAAGTRVVSAQPREVMERRRVAGWLATLRTRNGRLLTVTPNHPILTDRGWVRAHSLNVGDNLVCYRGGQALDEGMAMRPTGAAGLRGREHPDVEHVPPVIDEVFRAAAQRWPGGRVVMGAVDLYSDPADCEVEVVPLDSDLTADLQAPFGQPASQNIFSLTDTQLQALTQYRPLSQALGSHAERPVDPLGEHAFRGGRSADAEPLALRPDDPGLALVSQGDAGSLQVDDDGRATAPVALGEGCYGVACEVLLSDRGAVQVIPAADGHGQTLSVAGLCDSFRSSKAAADSGGLVKQLTALPEPPGDCHGTAADRWGDLGRSLSGTVALDELVDIELRWEASGHAVYDLLTDQGWFVAEGIVVHNSTSDDRTREDHRHADGQKVGVREKFTVGGWPADRPHDPALPAEQAIQCRCSLSFSVDLNDVSFEPAQPVVEQAQEQVDHQILGAVWVADAIRRGVTTDDLAALLSLAPFLPDEEEPGAETAAAEAFHLAGKHNQKTHGHGKKGGQISRPGMGDIGIDDDRLSALQGPYGGSAAPHLVQRPDGSYGFSPERQAMHDEIVRSHLEGKTPTDEPVYNMLGGGPASGKSTLVRQSASLQDPNTVVINADDIKDSLPEYRARIAAGDKGAGPFVHEESGYLAARVQAAAFEQRFNVTVDGVGDGSPPKLRSKVTAARAAGYRVNGQYVTIPTDTAVERANLRGERSGRFVPESITRQLHAGVSVTLPQAYEAFDSVDLFDNRGEGPLQHVMQWRDGSFTVHDPGLWDDFIAKGTG